MTDHLDAALDQLAQLPFWAVLVVVCVAMALETSILVGIVVPGDLVVLFAAAALVTGPVELTMLVVAVTLGSLIGETVGYAAGRQWGERLRHSRAGRRLGDERWARATDFLARRGGRAVFAVRFVAAVHALTSVVAGTVGMGYWRFIGWCAAGGLTWSALYAGLGVLAGASYREYADGVSAVTFVVVGGVAGAGALVALMSLRGTGALERWRARFSLPQREVVVLGALAGAVALATSVAEESGSQKPDLLAYTIGFTGVLSLLARRRWPIGVLAVSVVAFAAYNLCGYPAGPPVLAVAVAIHAAAAAGRRRPALAACGLVTGAGITYRWMIEGDPVVGVDMMLPAAFLAVVALLGARSRPPRAVADSTLGHEAQDEHALADPRASARSATRWNPLDVPTLVHGRGPGG